MDRETVVRLPRKVLKFVIAYKYGSKLYRMGRRVYNMIPKFDKITGIDTDILIDNCNKTKDA